MQGRIIRGTTLIYYFQHQSINRLGNNASVAHQSTCKAFADEFMGDLLNKRLLLPCTNRRLSKSLLPVFLPNHHISSC